MDEGEHLWDVMIRAQWRIFCDKLRESGDVDIQPDGTVWKKRDDHFYIDPVKDELARKIAVQKD